MSAVNHLDESIELSDFEDGIVDDFFDLLATGCMERTQLNYKYIISRFRSWLNTKELYIWQVDFNIIDTYIHELVQKKLKNKTIRCYLTPIKELYQYLVSRKLKKVFETTGYPITIPVDNLSYPHWSEAQDKLVPLPAREKIDLFKKQTENLVVQNIQNQSPKGLMSARNYTLSRVLYWGGLRRMEAAALTLANIVIMDKPENNLNAGYINVFGKGGKTRLVYMQLELATILRWYIDKIYPRYLFAPDKRQPLFPSAKGETKGQSISPIRVNRIIHEMQDAIGIPKDDQFSAHALRRVYATDLYYRCLSEGIDPLPHVQHNLGHADPSTTQQYCQLDTTYQLNRNVIATHLADQYRRP